MTIGEFVFNTPLYQKIDQTNGYNHIISSLSKQDKSIEFEGYNPIKKCDTTYYLHKGIGDIQAYSDYFMGTSGRAVYDSYYYSSQLLSEDGVRSIIIKCKRHGDTITIIVFHNVSKGTIVKVGQYPSVATIHIGQIKQYNKQLGESVSKEFTRAIGLAANGVGIGSFVYLRRIFEKLILDAYNQAKDSIDTDVFAKQRMDEKILTLRDHLPSFIVENCAIYKILSKGIHELSEDECLEHFDCLRKSIELILDEKIEQIEKRKREEAVKKSINDIASKIQQ